MIFIELEEMVKKLREELDDITEENRQLRWEVANLKADFKYLEKTVDKLS